MPAGGMQVGVMPVGGMAAGGMPVSGMSMAGQAPMMAAYPTPMVSDIGICLKAHGYCLVICAMLHLTCFSRCSWHTLQNTVEFEMCSSVIDAYGNLLGFHEI